MQLLVLPSSLPSITIFITVFITLFFTSFRVLTSQRRSIQAPRYDFHQGSEVLVPKLPKCTTHYRSLICRSLLRGLGHPPGLKGKVSSPPRWDPWERCLLMVETTHRSEDSGGPPGRQFPQRPRRPAGLPRVERWLREVLTQVDFQVRPWLVVTVGFRMVPRHLAVVGTIELPLPGHDVLASRTWPQEDLLCRTGHASGEATPDTH